MTTGPRKRPAPRTPAPTPDLMGYLDEAIESLGAVDPMTDNVAGFRTALESLDALRSGLHRGALPRGVGDRVAGATRELTAGQVSEALTLLEQIRAEMGPTSVAVERGERTEPDGIDSR